LLDSTGLHGPLVDQVLAQEDAATGDVDWLLADHQGTIRDVVRWDDTADETVTVTHFTYDTFGNVTSGDTTQTRYLYTGRDWDSDSGLQYNRARWYDPQTGRWISEDPIGFAAGDANLARYVGNGVTYATDPSGRERGTVQLILQQAASAARLARTAAAKAEAVRDAAVAFRKVVCKAKSLSQINDAFKKVEEALASAKRAEQAMSKSLQTLQGMVKDAKNIGVNISRAKDGLKQSGSAVGKAKAAMRDARGLYQKWKSFDFNNFWHIFGQSKHKLDGLVNVCGDAVAAFAKLSNAAGAAIKAGRLADGFHKIQVVINGLTVNVRVYVVGGSLKRITTAYM
jgi:RHS repeat-associated protein